MDNCYQWWENELNQQYREEKMTKELSDENQKIYNELMWVIIDAIKSEHVKNKTSSRVHLAALFSVIGHIMNEDGTTEEDLIRYFDGVRDNTLELLRQPRKAND